MNKGVVQSKGEWLLFLGADDKLYSKETLNNIFNKPIDNSTELILGKIKFDWKKNDTYFIKKNNGVITPSWSNQIWIKNTLPHQGIFYNRNVFEDVGYSLNYGILADYALNLKLYKEKLKVKVIDTIISVCATNGISKKYSWKLYKEEIKLKTEASSIVLKPFFLFIAGVKYIVKRLGF